MTSQNALTENIELTDEESKFNYPFYQIGDDVIRLQTTIPKQISIQAQEKNINALIGKVIEFKEQYYEDFETRYKNKHTNDNIEFNIENMSLQKNSRAVMSDAHGDLFSLLSAIYSIGFINLYKNNFLYFNLKTKQFVSREECYRILEEAAKKTNEAWQPIDIFLEHIEIFLQIINKKDKTIEQKINELQKYIKEKEILNFEIGEFNKFITFTYEKISIKIDETICGQTQRFSIKISDNNFTNYKELIYNPFNYVNDVKEMFVDWKKEFANKILNENFNTIFYVIPMLFINQNIYMNPDSYGKFIDLGDSIDRGPESVACLVTYALLSKAIPQSIKCMLGNHETMQRILGYDNNDFVNLIDFCIENRILKAGYIEKSIVNGKTIWRAYSHTIFTKKHLPKLFALLVILSYISSSETSDIANAIKKRLDDDFEKYLKEKWSIIFNSLDKALQEKLTNFLKDNDLKELLLNYFNVYDPNPKSFSWKDSDDDLVDNDNEDKFKKIEWQNFYKALIELGFTNNEFFELKFALCSIFYNNYYATALTIWESVFKSLCGDMFWPFGERYVPNDKNELFDNVIQYLGHDYGDFVLIPESLGGLVIYLDTYRSAGYRNNESRLNLLLINIMLNTINNYNGIITISGFLDRNEFEISEKSRLILDKSSGKFIFNSIIRSPQKTFIELENNFKASQVFAIKNKSKQPKKFSSTKLIKEILFTGSELETELDSQKINFKNQTEEIQKQVETNQSQIKEENSNKKIIVTTVLSILFFAIAISLGILAPIGVGILASLSMLSTIFLVGTPTLAGTILAICSCIFYKKSKQKDNYNQLNSSNIELNDDQENFTTVPQKNSVPLHQRDKVNYQTKF